MAAEQSNSGTVRELKEAIEQIKDHWQKGEYFEMPGPIERARSLASDLDSDGDSSSNERDREDCIRGHTAVHDLYPWDEIRNRAIEDASADLDQFGVPKDEVEIRYAMLDDGVLHYKLEHEDIPTIDYGRSVDTEGDRHE